MNAQTTDCPFCKNVIDIDVSWAIKNGAVFCGHCCKSFEIRVGKDTKDKLFDEGVKEILEEPSNFDWDEF